MPGGDTVGEVAGPVVDQEEQLGRRAASGMLWLAAQKWVVRISGFATLVVLTRHVSPVEFGVVAAAMTVIPVLYLLADLGFSTFLLQSAVIDRRSLSTAFWASAAAGVVLSAALWLAAPLVAQGFRSDDLRDVLRVLVLAVVPTVLTSVPLALLRRSMRFRAVALQSLVAALLAQAVAVVLALQGHGVWALVGQVVTTQWVIAVLAWRSARWVPSFQLSRRLFREMATFGVRVSSVDLVAALRMWVESWIVTVTLGPAALGLLSIAQRLVMTAQELTAVSLTPVSTVVFAKVRSSAERLRSSYLKALGVAYAVVAPVMVLIVVTSPGLVPALFGGQWQRSVIPAQALAVAGMVTIGAMLDHGLFYGLGRPGTWLAYALAVDATSVAVTAVGVHWGLVGVTVGFVGLALVATAARWVLVARLVGASVPELARSFATVLMPSVLAAGAGVLFYGVVFGPEDGWVGLVLTGVATVLLTLVLLRLAAGSVLRDVVGLMPVPERHADRMRRLLRLGPVCGV
jgi:O-antigen/teichoic acid export membrane protein